MGGIGAGLRQRARFGPAPPQRVLFVQGCEEQLQCSPRGDPAAPTLLSPVINIVFVAPSRFKGGIPGSSTVPQRPSTALRRNGQVALTVLRPTSAVIRGQMADETAAVTGSGAGRGGAGTKSHSAATAGKMRSATSLEAQGVSSRDLPLKVIEAPRLHVTNAASKQTGHEID